MKALPTPGAEPSGSSWSRSLRFPGGVLIWRILAWSCAIVLLAPVVFVLWGVVSGADGGSWDHVQSNLLGPAVRDTAILVAGVCLFAFLLGVPAAWCVSSYQFPGRSLLSVLLVLPLAVPPYVAAYASTEAREAFIPTLVKIRQDWGVEAFLKIELIHRFGWLVLIFAAVLYPYVFLACRSSFSGASRRLAEASRSLGAGGWKTFWSVNLPLARPALVAGLFLVAMEVLNDYGAVHHLGIDTMTVKIFRTWFDLGELETARRLAGWMLLGVFALVLVEQCQRGRRRFSSGLESVAPRRRCGTAGTISCWLVCLLPVFLGLLLPVYVLLDWLGASAKEEPLTEVLNAARNSLLLGAGVTMTCLAIGLIIAGIARFTKTRSDRLLGQVSGIAGYASPGAVMAVGILGLAAILRNLFHQDTWLGSQLLSDSLLWLGFALTARYIAISIQMTRQSHSSIPGSYDQAASTLGRGPLASFLTIHLPLLRPALAGAAVLIFVDVCKELPLCLLLRPFDFETLGTWTFSLIKEDQIFACATPSLILILTCATGLTLVEAFGWRHQRRRQP
ncbi:MAG: iron ABC transporter permease [Roseibacillus sp.]|nr:iron ABC transporter permease [Roseibacillus sp.]